MAVAFDAKATTVTVQGAPSSPIANSTLTVGASGTLVIGVFSAVTDTTLAIPTAMTWNGVVMTLVSSKIASDNHSSIYVYAIISPAIGNLSCSCTFTNGSGSQQVDLDCFSFTGTSVASVSACIPSSNILTDASSPAGTVYPTSAFAVTTVSGDAVCAVCNSVSTNLNGVNIGTLINKDGTSLVNYVSLYNLATTVSTQAQFTDGGVNGFPCEGIAFDITQPTGAVEPRAPHITKLLGRKFLPTPDQSYNQALYGVTVSVLPFNQTDFGRGNILPDWASTPPPPLNINLFTNPYPFNQIDWSVTERVPKAPFIPTDPLNINLFTNLIPFNQIDWSKPFRVPLSLPQPSLPLNINLFTNSYPFNQYDWSKSVRIPQAPIDLSFQFNQNLTNFFPFNQTDWSKPFNVPHAPFDLSVPLNPNIFTNSYPVLNIDTSRPARLARLPQVDIPYNQSLYTITVVALPFNQTDWSKPFRVLKAPFDLSVPLNPNIFTNPIPVLNIDASRPIRLVGLPQVNAPYNQTLYTITISATPFNQTYWPPASRVPNAPVDFYNLVLYGVTILPFNQIDWSKPFTVPRAPFDQSVSLNLNLFTNPYPVLNINSVIVPPRRVTVLVDQTYNQSLYTVTVTAPFYAPEILFLRKPVSSPLPDLPLNINLFTNPIPILATDRLPTFKVPLTLSQADIPYNQSLYTITVTTTLRGPLIMRPYPIRSAPFDTSQSNNPNLFTNPIPVFNYDGSIPVRTRGFVDTSQPYNINLYGVVTVTVTTTLRGPLIMRPYPIRSAPFDTSQSNNPNLFTNPIPFSQYDWRKPFGVPHAPFDLSVQTNPNLFKNSFPFNQYQYPTQQPVKLGPPHVPPYNQNLYTATLGTTSHIVKFIGNVGHFMIR